MDRTTGRGCRVARRRGVGTGVVGAAGLALIMWLCGGCIGPGAGRDVAVQNQENIGALVQNTATVLAACRDLAGAHGGVVRRAARERVAAALIDIRASIAPQSPTPSELSDAEAPWATSLMTDIAALRARINTAPPGEREAVAASLANEHPAEIDAAIGTPGFDVARMLRDAVALDTLNVSIAGESNAAVRAGLLARRDTILDPYEPVRLASASIDAASKSMAAMSARLEEESRIAGVHARALGDFTSDGTGGPGSSALAVYHDRALRAAVLDLVREAAGDAAAGRVHDRLSRIDAALGAFR